ncbi:MAG: response regulator transcription factor [Cyanobacteria bacterium J06632_22]
MPQAIICAEHALTRTGLAAMATAANLTVVGQVETVAALAQWLRTQATVPSLQGDVPSPHLVPDLALVECPMVTATIDSGLTQILDRWPTLGVLLLLDDAELDEGQQRHVQHLFSLGTVSLLPLTTDTDPLKTAIATVCAGLTVLHPDLTEIAFSTPAFPLDRAAVTPAEPLSPREIEVLNQLADGSSNKAIAQALGISDHTVKFHISAILAKLGVTSRTEAVTVGIRSGLILL